MKSVHKVLWFLSVSGTVLVSGAEDWPQFLGPNRNGIAPDAENLARNWPQEGPPVVWRRNAGEGFASPIIAQGKLILFHRIGGEEIIECLEADTGEAVWKFGYPATYRDDFGNEEGPRGTPAISDHKVYAFGADGALHCLDLATGKKIWKVDTKTKFQASKGFFGLACSPLVAGNSVLLNIGGRPGAGIVALHKETGELLWKATDHEASYSSPVQADFGKPQALFFTRQGLVGVNPANGEIHFEYPWRSRMNASVNAATPLVIGDLIFLSASYQTGAVLLRMTGGKLEEIWSGDGILSNHYATSIHHEGFFYGFDGRVDFPGGPHLRCVELRTGKIQWSQDHFGDGTLLLAGSDLLILMEDGRLIRAPASPRSFQRTGQTHIVSSGARAHPALAGGYFYARGKSHLVCLDLRERDLP